MRDFDENKMTVHIVRHGKTIANEQRLYCGETDLPLSEYGAQEIVSYKNEGIYPEASRFYSSGLIRADETLRIIYGDIPINAVPDIAEFRFGQFEMNSYADLVSMPEYQAWIADNTGMVACPGGECKNEFDRRVLKGFETILSRSQYESAFVVCHGGVIARIMDSLFPNERNFYEWQPRPGRGYTLTGAPGRLDTYNTI